ncbi:MAG TPA: chromate efflux transporter [bacterium]
MSLPDRVPEAAPVGLWQLVRYFLRLGALGFGGPIALAGSMQRDLVPRRWITEEEYVQGLAFSQMMPGPLAAQLAMWIGYLRHGALGASLVGIAFILPTYLIVLAVSALYVAYHGLSLVQALFYGIGPMVIAIVAISATRLARTTVGGDWRMWLVFVAAAVVTLVTRAEIALLFLAAGLLGIVIHSPPARNGAALPLAIAPIVGGAGVHLPILLAVGAFFLKAGAFTFGSGLAIVPFLHHGVVVEHRWLDERQFLDAVAVGIITPGPVVITAAFVGYLVAGLRGSLVAAAGVFLPVYLFVLFIGRYIIRWRHHPVLHGFVKGATSAASGAIAAATLILGQGSIVDAPTAVIAAAGAILLLRFRVPEPAVVAAGAIAGIVLRR